jgi:Tfp pilus assembly protein PilZ
MHEPDVQAEFKPAAKRQPKAQFSIIKQRHHGSYGMIATDPTLGKFSITARLFNLVSEMPKDQQLILLKQLVGERVAAHLYKLIVDMTEEQQIILLEQMGESPQVDLPVKTVSIEDSDASMRENLRKPCLINSSFMIQDRKLKSYILDISIGGVFIESNAKFPVGQDLLLKFSLPHHPQPFTFSGKIAWSSTRGFGVKFENVGELQGDILKSFIEQNE